MATDLIKCFDDFVASGRFITQVLAECHNAKKSACIDNFLQSQQHVYLDYNSCIEKTPERQLVHCTNYFIRPTLIKAENICPTNEDCNNESYVTQEEKNIGRLYNCFDKVHQGDQHNCTLIFYKTVRTAAEKLFACHKVAKQARNTSDCYVGYKQIVVSALNSLESCRNDTLERKLSNCIKHVNDDHRITNEKFEICSHSKMSILQCTIELIHNHSVINSEDLSECRNCVMLGGVSNCKGELIKHLQANRLAFPAIYYNHLFDGLECMVLPEDNEYTSLELTVDPEVCLSYSCWDSYLTLKNKALMSFLINTLRQTYSEECNVVIPKLVWHWSLEHNAAQVLRECPSERTVNIETRDIPGLGYNMSCEETVVKFQLTNNSQTHFLFAINSFLSNITEDKLNNFNDDGTFRRASATHYGCSHIVSNSPPIEGYLVCIYCTNGKHVSEPLSECPNGTAAMKNMVWYPLCIPILDKLTEKYAYDRFICEQKKVKSLCFPDPPTPEWSSNSIHPYNGTIFKFYFIKTTVENHYSLMQDEPALGEPIIDTCDLFFPSGCPPPVSGWFHIYSKEQLFDLNMSIRKLTNLTLLFPARHSKFNTIQFIDQGYEKAKCCIYFFCLFLMVLSVIVLGCVYTYLHIKRKMKPTMK